MAFVREVLRSLAHVVHLDERPIPFSGAERWTRAGGHAATVENVVLGPYLDLVWDPNARN